jgi:hypothetical protein
MISASDILPWWKAVWANSKSRKLATDRQHEVSILGKVLRKERRGSFVVCCANMRILDKNWLPIAEFDGLYLRIEKRSMRLKVIEAKRGISRRSEKGRHALSTKLQKVLKAGLTGKIQRGNGYASATIVLTESRLNQTND